MVIVLPCAGDITLTRLTLTRGHSEDEGGERTARVQMASNKREFWDEGRILERIV